MEDHLLRADIRRVLDQLTEPGVRSLDEMTDAMVAVVADALAQSEAARREPTEAMIAAGWKVANEIGPTTLGVISDSTCAAIYRAMVSAALTAPGEKMEPQP